MNHFISYFIIIQLTWAKFLDYRSPGTYIIGEADYQKADIVTVEIWGAGAGGNACVGGAGGGGAYLKASLLTKNRRFTITVGEGGRGGYSINCPDGMCINSGKMGGSSSLIAEGINLLAEGGYPNIGIYTGQGGLYQVNAQSLDDIIYIEAYPGFSGESAYCMGGRCYCNEAGYPYGGKGGAAGFGGAGGKGIGFYQVCSHYYNDTFSCDGYYPGGGGGGAWNWKPRTQIGNYGGCPPDTTTLGDGGHGANGRVLLYYESAPKKNNTNDSTAEICVNVRVFLVIILISLMTGIMLMYMLFN